MVGHIPREISRYGYFFIKQEGGWVYGKLKSLKYKPSAIPSGGLEVPLLLKFESQDKRVTDTMEEFVENFYFFDFAGDLVTNDENEEEIDFETLDIKKSNENDESEINEKDEETVTLDDPITNETKEVPVVIIDWFMILKAIKKIKKLLLSNITGENFHQEKATKYFPGEELFSPTKVFPDKVFPDKV